MNLQDLAGAVARSWAVNVASAELFGAGMNSTTALVVTSEGRFIAKWVPQTEGENLLRGAIVAQTMADGGMRSGPPLPARDGALTVSALGGELALLHEVRGRFLSTASIDQPAWGGALARVHGLARGEPSGSFLDALLGPVSVDEPWVMRVFDSVQAEVAGLPPVTWAQLHTDPEPEAFLIDDLGDVGVIDWTGSIPGPVLYDVASAVMYAGGEANAGALIESYLAGGVISPAELSTHLRTFSRMRGAVQAVYFSRRVASGDLTGITDPDENLHGLDDARRMLAELDVDVT